MKTGARLPKWRFSLPHQRQCAYQGLHSIGSRHWAFLSKATESPQSRILRLSLTSSSHSSNSHLFISFRISPPPCSAIPGNLLHDGSVQRNRQRICRRVARNPARRLRSRDQAIPTKCIGSSQGAEETTPPARAARAHTREYRGSDGKATEELWRV